MMGWFRGLFGLTLVFLLGAAKPSVYFVDYERGNDAATGTTPAAAWRHSPGDPAASGRAASAQLVPGDTIRFKGGVAYRGTIVAKFDGSKTQPITYTGAGFGDAPAIIDGADPVISTQPCPSSSACGEASQWQKLSLVTFRLPATAFIKLFDDSGPLAEAQFPAPKDPFFADDVQDYLVSPLSDKTLIEAGQLRAPELARQLGGRAAGTLSIWVAGNLVARRAVTGVNGQIISFEPGNLRLHDDRPGRYALMGVASAVSAPGQYAVIAPGRAVVWPRSKGPLLVGSGRRGFNLGGQGGITISGFLFTRQTGAAGAAGEGLPIERTGRYASDISIIGNRFSGMALWSGQGVISLRNVDTAMVRGNIIELIERGSGVRVGGNIRKLSVIGNRIDRLGRTGIAFFGVAEGVIADNVITDLRGIHGNGISLYLNNRGVRVSNNNVTGTTRPMTFHGDKSTEAPGDHDFVIDHNVFIATAGGQAALTSWGLSTRGVSIKNNVLIGPKLGVLLNGTDGGVVVQNNYLSGLITNAARGQEPGWRVDNNREAPKNLRMNAADPGLCKSASVAKGAKLGGIAC